MENKKGFTLLELLVAILIIGLLAAIALPQYRKARDKAEASELLINVKALHEAQKRYYLANGTFTENFDDLDIDFSGYDREDCGLPSNFLSSDCISNEKNIVYINTRDTSIALRKTGKYRLSGFLFKRETDEYVPENELICYEYGDTGFCSDLLKCKFISKRGQNNNYYSCSF